jgi:hypothetical protein
MKVEEIINAYVLCACCLSNLMLKVIQRHLMRVISHSMCPSPCIPTLQRSVLESAHALVRSRLLASARKPLAAGEKQVAAAAEAAAASEPQPQCARSIAAESRPRPEPRKTDPKRRSRSRFRYDLSRKCETVTQTGILVQ